MYGRGSPVGFGPPVTPPVIKNLLIANAVVFVAQIFSAGSGGGSPITAFGAVEPYGVWQQGRFWQPFTYMWLHGGPMHLLFNLFALWMFGSTLVLHWGEQRFLRYYLTCGIGAGFLIATVPYIPWIAGFDASFMGLHTHTLGASGAIFGVLLAYSFTWPDRTIMLIFPPIPIKAIWLIPFLLFIGYASGPSNVSHLGHLAGALVGWIYLVNEGRTPGAPTFQSLQYRWKRYQMRQKLRAVRDEEDRERRSWDDDDRRFH